MPAAEQFGCRRGEERPGNRLVEAALGKTPAGRHHAALLGVEDRPRHGMQARHRRWFDGVEADDAADFLHQIGFAADVETP